ncbi:MAG: carboxypeptidase regulatory-like domain-containing protein [Deltaproteobacteria bacterium]|nr:carboxypeptidase regulatory-like domain-containing protein [Deltaproteobacteria bacterium]
MPRENVARILVDGLRRFAEEMAIEKRSSRLGAWSAIYLAVAIGFEFIPFTLATAQTTPIGNGSSALPAFDRVGHAVYLDERACASLSAEYGYTESVLEQEDEHHRLLAKVGASLIAVEWLALALRFDGRYDSHGFENLEGDDGIAGQTQLTARASYELNQSVHLGGETVFRVPAGKTPGDAFQGASFDLNLIGSYIADSLPLVVASLIGFRMDNSAHAIDRADAMSRADRLALGVSEANAILVGLAGSWREGEVELLGEWTWDLYFGEPAPSAFESPIRFVVGARWWQSPAFQLSALLGVTASARPEIDANNPLSVVEPRFWIGLGANYTLGFHERGKSASGDKSEQGRITGRVVTSAGAGISAARITLSGKRSLQAVSDADGGFRIDGVPVGKRTLLLHAEGWRKTTVSIMVRRGTNPPLEIALEPEIRPLQGAVYTPSKEPIPNATIWIGKGDRGIETKTDDAGRFEFRELPADALEMKVKATGWEELTKKLDRAALGTEPIEIALERPLPEGQIRGHVRSFEGKPLNATIVIEPIGMRMQVDAKGTFQVDVPPGSYRVTVQAPGHRTQKRPVVVEHKGVTVLVVDLQKKR